MTLPTRQKIGLFCNVPTERVLSLYDVPTIYRVPLEMLERSMPHGPRTPDLHGLLLTRMLLTRVGLGLDRPRPRP